MDVRPIDANALMDLARNHVNRTVDCNDIARFPILDYAPRQQWISVKERLPESTDLYLVNAVHRYNKADGYRSAQVRLYFKDDDEWHGLPDLYEVTHWMSLPEPPKEDAE